MKTKFSLCGLCSAIAVISVTAVITSCNKDDDYEYLDEQAYTLARSTRSAMYPEGGTSNYPFLKYSNCGLWSIAQMCGGADKSIYQGAVFSAAKSSINWDEEENMNNSIKRGLTGEEILSVCNQMKELNNNKKGLEKLSGLDKNLPNTYEHDGANALQIIEELKTSANGKKIHGAMVGIETYDANGNLVGHWVPLEGFTKDGNMQVRDQNTSQQYANQERSGSSQYSDRYKATYPVSRVKCILYKK